MQPTDMTRRTFVASSIAAAAYASTARAAGGKIRIGQIGTGHAHAAGKLATIRKLSELYEVIGVVEPDPARRAAVERSQTYRGLTWMTEEQLLDTPGLHAVAVETEVRDLIPTAHRCVARGLHVHVDKPAGESLSAYRRMRDTATAKGAVVQMGYMLRYNPGVNLCHQAVREGWLGQVFAVHAEMSKRSDRERAKLAAYKGGIMFELGCHLLDSIVYMFGKPAKVTPFVRASGLGGDSLNDNMLAVLEWPQTVATVKSSLIDFAGSPRRQLVLSGTEGTADLRPLESNQLQLTLARPVGKFKRGAQQVTPAGGGGRYDGEFTDLAAAIRGEKPLAWTAGHDLAVHETILLASGMPLD